MFQAVNCSTSLSLPVKGNYSTLTYILIYSIIFNLNGTPFEFHFLFALCTTGVEKDTFFAPNPEICPTYLLSNMWDIS